MVHSESFPLRPLPFSLRPTNLISLSVLVIPLTSLNDNIMIATTVTVVVAPLLKNVKITKSFDFEKQNGIGWLVLLQYSHYSKSFFLNLVYYEEYLEKEKMFK